MHYKSEDRLHIEPLGSSASDQKLTCSAIGLARKRSLSSGRVILAWWSKDRPSATSASHEIGSLSMQARQPNCPAVR